MTKSLGRPNLTARRLLSVCAAGVLSSSLLFTGGPTDASTEESGCELPTGTLTRSDLPRGESAVECDAVGREIESGDMGIIIPPVGEGVSMTVIKSDGEMEGFGVEVADDGTVSYSSTVTASALTTSAAAAASSPSSCVDDDYKLLGFKEYGTWNWYIGDGGKPAAMTLAEARNAYGDAVNNMTQSTNTCDYTDQVDASASYQGTSTVESDVSASGVCTEMDSKSTIDAGDLPSSWLAVTCAHTRGVPAAKDDLIQADIRFNTHDKDFIDGVSGCINQHDVRSVLTHEVGHVFGLGDMGGAHDWLTMSSSSGECETRMRTLAKGDVLGMRSLY